MKRCVSVILAAALLLLSGCFSPEPPVAETDKLVICVDGRNQLIATYVAWQINEIGPGPFLSAYPHVEVEIITIPDPATDPELYEVARQKLWTELMSGGGPDLFFLDSSTLDFEGIFPDVDKAMRNGLFCDLNPLLYDAETGKPVIEIWDEYSDVMLEAGQVDGKQYVLPMTYKFTTIITNDMTYERLGITETSGTPDVLAGLRTVFEPPGAGRMAIAAGSEDNFAVLRTHEDGWSNDIFLNPYDYTSGALIDYDAESINIDTPLTRDILATGKFLKEHTRRLQDEGWLRESQAFSKALTGEFEDYARSEEYVIVSNPIATQWQEGPFITNFYGFLPHLDAIPAEDGGITAIVTAYAAVRANSPNKLNAMRYLSWVFPSSRITFYDRPFHENTNDYTLGTTPITSLTDFSGGMWRRDGLNIQSWQSVEQLNSLWQRVSNTRFPVPKEVTDIIAQYYDGEIDCDAAISRMEDYWRISLEE